MKVMTISNLIGFTLMLQKDVWDTWMHDLGCTDMKCRIHKRGACLSYRRLPTEVQYWAASQTTNGQHVGCYVG